MKLLNKKLLILKKVISKDPVRLYRLLFFISIVSIWQCSIIPGHNIKKETFHFLNKIKKQKKLQVIKYLKSRHRKAVNIKNNKKMVYYFKKLYQNCNLKTKNKSALNLKELEWEIDRLYVKEYGDFYDILFIDSNGYVFHSIKKEADYHSNIFSGKLTKTTLAKYIKENPDRDFIDYEYYSPSDEPAAFFVVSIHQKGKHLGWFVLQCAINKINTLLTDYENLGRTGEVYLVNKKNLMLSESRFLKNSTILKLKIDTQAVKVALEKKSGNRIIKDYRGVTVFSAFEQFNFLGNTWIIIAEIDEDEIITNHYKKYRNYYFKRICQFLTEYPREKNTPIKKQKYKKVDINEYSKTEHKEMLVTKGVGLCTAIVISYPEKFAYLVHISPADDIYINNPLVKLFLKDKYTNFLYDLLKRIKYYDIYPYELRKLDFFIVATHNKSCKSIIDRLLSQDVDVAQINFIFNPQADLANIFFDGGNASLIVEWVNRKTAPVNFWEDASVVENLGTIIKEIAGYDDEPI